MSGQRYLANTSSGKRDVHDLANGNANCQIDEIIRAGNEWPYTSLAAAHAAGYDNCFWCLRGSKR